MSAEIQAVQANLRVRWSVDRAVQDADHVINLVGILFESGRQRFASVQDFGARAVAEAARSVGAGLTHGSALGADAGSQSDYARTKAKGEAAVMETVPDAVIYRPSIIFGPEDGFFNRFANMACFSPVLPLIGGGETKFQPVFVGDVAEAVARSVDGKVERGKIYELGGPQVLSFRQCLEEMLEIIDRKRILVTVPWPIASMQAAILGMLPNPRLTKDQVHIAEDGQCGQRRSGKGWPHFRGNRLAAADDRVGPALIPLALSRRRAVHAAHRGLTSTKSDAPADQRPVSRSARAASLDVRGRPFASRSSAMR